MQGLPAVWASHPGLGCGCNALQSANTKFTCIISFRSFKTSVSGAGGGA